MRPILRSGSFLALLPALMLTGPASATPREDLASPDPAVRDQAAAEIRRTFVPTPESKWAPVMAKIRKGQTSEEVLAFFPPNIQSTGAGGSGSASGANFKIDGDWNFSLSSTNQDHKVFSWGLNYAPSSVWVEPPAHFTGLWTCYYVTGSKYLQTNYRDGQPAGASFSFHPNGAPSMTTTSSPDEKDFDQSQYDTEGRIRMRTIRQHDDPFQVTIYYDAFGERERSISPAMAAHGGLATPELDHEAGRRTAAALREILKSADELSAAAEERLSAAPPEEREKLADDAQQKRERLTPIRNTLGGWEGYVRNVAAQEAAAQKAATSTPAKKKSTR